MGKWKNASIFRASHSCIHISYFIESKHIFFYIRDHFIRKQGRSSQKFKKIQGSGLSVIRNFQTQKIGKHEISSPFMPVHQNPQAIERSFECSMLRRFLIKERVYQSTVLYKQLTCYVLSLIFGQQSVNKIGRQKVWSL